MFERLGVYVLLRLLMERKRNLGFDLVWRHNDLLNGGWIDETDVIPRVPVQNKFLIVTEGSTDSFIIEKAMNLLRPDVADFFSFIDMKDHYPFTGTGNLVNFCKGLAKISIQNRTLVLFDNDAEGVRQLDRLSNIEFPSGMMITKLPDHPAFRKVPAIGTDGIKRSNINGKGVSIEWFLDLTRGPSGRAPWGGVGAVGNRPAAAPP